MDHEDQLAAARKVGLILGLIFMVCLVISGALVIRQVGSAVDQGKASVSSTRLKVLSVAMLIYADENGGRLPMAAAWREGMGLYVMEPSNFESPYQGESFALNARIAGQGTDGIADPGRIPLLFESRLPGPAFAGGREDLSPRKDAAIVSLSLGLERSPEAFDWNRP